MEWALQISIHNKLLSMISSKENLSLMKKNLKYVKIEGTLKSRGDYIISPSEYRPYGAVTIVDNDGDEIHFHTLSISKRMDEDLSFGKPMVFYILRYRQKEKLIGVLYAVENDGTKLYYPDTAIPALKSLGLQVTKRYQCMLDPTAMIAILIFGGGIISLGFGVGLGFSFIPAALLGFGGVAGYLSLPMIFQAEGAGISEMQDILDSSGFNTTASTNSKY